MWLALDLHTVALEQVEAWFLLPRLSDLSLVILLIRCDQILWLFNIRFLSHYSVHLSRVLTNG
jgi:hypothetical protein